MSAMRDAMDDRGAARRTAAVRVFATAAEADAADRLFWAGLSAGQRVLETWRLSEELWRLRREFNDEPGLCRSVARLHRR